MVLHLSHVYHHDYLLLHFLRVKVIQRSKIKGCHLFNLLSAVLRNANNGDILMFKNNLDHYLSSVPDQPTISGLSRAAKTNSLLHQIPMMGGWE